MWRVIRDHGFSLGSLEAKLELQKLVYRYFIWEKTPRKMTRGRRNSQHKDALLSWPSLQAMGPWALEGALRNESQMTEGSIYLLAHLPLIKGA